MRPREMGQCSTDGTLKYLSVSWLLKKLLTRENLSLRLHKPQIKENTQKYCSTTTAICRQRKAITNYINTVLYAHKSLTQAYNCGKNCSGGNTA
jgi:hypothetical protein